MTTKRRTKSPGGSANLPKAKNYPPRSNGQGLEAKNPEGAGAALADLAADPSVSSADLAEKLGVSKGVVDGFLRRCRTRYVGLKDGLQQVGNKDLQALIDDRAYRALQYMDDDLMMRGSLKDVTYAFDRLMNMRQLMRGEPTAILTVEDRQGLNKLVPLLLKESQRRGMIMDGEYEVVNGGAAEA